MGRFHRWAADTGTTVVAGNGKGWAAHVPHVGMARRQRGGYHEWRAFIRCPECGSDAVEFDFYPEGTMFRCSRCGAEAWSEEIGETES